MVDFGRGGHGSSVKPSEINGGSRVALPLRGGGSSFRPWSHPAASKAHQTRGSSAARVPGMARVYGVPSVRHMNALSLVAALSPPRRRALLASAQPTPGLNVIPGKVVM